MPPQDDRLRHALHEEAERHLPDRDAMLARIARRRGTGMSFLRRPIGPQARRFLAVAYPVAAALAVAGVLVAVSLPNQSAPQVADRPAATQPSSSAPAPDRDRFLTATGTLNPFSIAHWAQSDLTLATTEEITELSVTVRVARTAGVADTGHWTTIPTALITSGVTTTEAEIVYRFTLHRGARLAPGSYTFAVQYNHATGARSMAEDSYEATATASTEAHVSGTYG